MQVQALGVEAHHRSALLGVGAVQFGDHPAQFGEHGLGALDVDPSAVRAAVEGGQQRVPDALRGDDGAQIPLRVQDDEVDRQILAAKGGLEGGEALAQGGDRGRIGEFAVGDRQ